MKLPVYLDNHATTRVDPLVVEAMLPWFSDEYGNAASAGHIFGWRAEAAVEQARERIAEAIGALSSRDVIFTSGATESDNLALLGVVRANAARGDHLVVAVTEHSAVLDCCQALESEGNRITRLPVDGEGLVDPDDVARAITDRTVLVSVMAANNEIGVLQPVKEIGAICRGRGVLFHSDAAQALGKIPLDVEASQIDLLSVSAHKLYGPKGVGALFVRSRQPRVRLEPLIHGGGHERGRRSGTLPVPLIVGFAQAVDLCLAELPAEAVRLARLRDHLASRLFGELEGVVRNGHATRRLPGNLNLSFEGIDGEALVVALKDVAVSTGSACTSATPEPSHVLRALGRSPALVRAGVRFGIGRFNDREEIEFAADSLVKLVGRLRRGSVDSPGAAPPA